jgi:hypothetical protein
MTSRTILNCLLIHINLYTNCIILQEDIHMAAGLLDTNTFDVKVRTHCTFYHIFNGTVSRDFLLLGFFMNQFPPSPNESH